MVRRSPGTPPTRRDEIVRSFCGVVWATVPTKVDALPYLDLVAPRQKWRKSSLDAAQLDGASSWRTLWGIVVPNQRAPLAALGILLFISTWNEYFWPLLVTRKIESSVIQVGLQMFMSQEGDLWGPLMAAASLASLPIFALYLVL